MVVNKALHGLVGVPIGGFDCTLPGAGDDLCRVLAGQGEATAQGSRNSAVIGRGVFKTCSFVGGLFGSIHGLDHCVFCIVQIQLVLYRLGEAAAVSAQKRFCNALGHAVVEVGDGLSAVLIVLVGLNGDGSQCGIAGDALGLSQIAVTGGKATVEQPENINLAAGGG